MRCKRASDREGKNIKIGVDDIWWLIIGAFVSHDKNKYDRNRAQERKKRIVEPNFNEDDIICKRYQLSRVNLSRIFIVS